MLYSFCHSNTSYFPYTPFFSALFELCGLSLRLEKHLLMLLCILVHCHSSLGLWMELNNPSSTCDFPTMTCQKHFFTHAMPPRIFAPSCRLHVRSHMSISSECSLTCQFLRLCDVRLCPNLILLTSSRARLKATNTSQRLLHKKMVEAHLLSLKATHIVRPVHYASVVFKHDLPQIKD